MTPWPLYASIVGTLFIVFAGFGARLKARLPQDEDDNEQQA